MKFKLNQKNIPLLTTLLVFIIIYVAGAFMYRGFFSPRVFINLFIDNAFVGIIAVGMTFVIISGGIDLSVGSFVAFTGVLSANLLANTSLDPVVVIIICLLSGALFGFSMGSLIHFLELPPFLVTLVGMFLARGLSFVISLDSVPIRDETFLKLSSIAIHLNKGIKIPFIAIIFICTVILGVLLLRYTRFGRNVYAIGGNEKSALLMGLPVGKTKVLIYTLNSTLCALGGLVYSLYTLAGYPLAGTGLELDVIAAVVIGGTLLTGGMGFIEGTLIGILILGLIQTIITFQGNLSTWWTKIFIGVLISLFILLQRYLSTRNLNKNIQK
ncbi:MAG: sugar ABC transporter permease YjfF [Spirochaetales bacterium]|nr:sugar ABC transporter permease YjfF [Spirochaetales bacterium]